MIRADITAQQRQSSRKEVKAGRRSAHLDGHAAVQRRLAEIREAKSRAQQPSAAPQRRRSDAGIERGARERRKLAGLPHNRAQYREYIRCAVVAQSVHRRRRKHAVGRSDDRAAGRKWNPVRGGDPGRNV